MLFLHLLGVCGVSSLLFYITALFILRDFIIYSFTLTDFLILNCPPGFCMFIASFGLLIFYLGFLKLL